MTSTAATKPDLQPKPKRRAAKRRFKRKIVADKTVEKTASIDKIEAATEENIPIKTKAKKPVEKAVLNKKAEPKKSAAEKSKKCIAKNSGAKKKQASASDANIKAEKSFEERIKAEKNRLVKNFDGIDKKKRIIVQGLIERAAFMKITLDDIETDIKENGYIEKFSQGEQEPYDRKRPCADLYNTLNANYQKIIKQLTDLLPKDEPAKTVSDGFDEFAQGRDDF